MTNRRGGGRRVGRAGAGEFAAVTSVAGAGALALALMFSGAATAASTASTASTASRASTGAVASPPATTAAASTSSSSSTTATGTPTPTPTPEEVTISISEQVVIPFASTSVEDPSLLTGVKAIRTSGRTGVKTVTWLVRTRGGTEVGRSVSGEQVTTPAVDEVVAVGTAVPTPPPAAKTTAPPAPKTTPRASNTACHPSYTGACVPFASDVDCAGGKGNGPAYVVGPVRVVGEDVYELDSDGDGIACEKR